MLERLADEGAQATFFVMAGRAAAHPALVDRMRADGHEVALHCVRHARHTEIDEQTLRRDTEEGLGVLERLGVQSRHWRAPWGVTTATSRTVAGDLGLELVGWDLDTHDWRGDSAATMHARVAGEIRAGSVMLMHDGLGPGARRTDCRETLALIPALLATLRAKVLRPVAVWDLPS